MQQWVLDAIDGLRQFPRLAVAVVLVAGAVSWWASWWYYTRTISNLRSQSAVLQTELQARANTISDLRSEVAQLRTQSEARTNAPPGPLPRYSLGGSDILVHHTDDWATQDTARRVELDWDSLEDLEADAVLRVRTEGDTGWVQGRIINATDREIVATTERRSGPPVLVRFRLPRARGVKTYAMEIRGQSAGLDGEIQLVRP